MTPVGAPGGAAAHALDCLTRLADATSCVEAQSPLRGRSISHAGIQARTVVSPTGSAWFRLDRNGRTSLACVHDLDPLGRSVLRRLVLGDGAGAARLLAAAAAAAVPIGPGIVSDDADPIDRRERLHLLMRAALGACIARDPDLDVAQCIVSSAPSRPLVSFAQSGVLAAPAPSETLLAAIDAVGTVRRFVPTRTWQVVASLLPGPPPSWGDGPDGVTLVDEEDLCVEAPDALSRMRVIATGAKAASALGIDPSTLLDEPAD